MRKVRRERKGGSVPLVATLSPTSTSDLNLLIASMFHRARSNTRCCEQSRLQRRPHPFGGRPGSRPGDRIFTCVGALAGPP